MATKTTDTQQPADHLEMFVKPWVRAAEEYWGTALGQMVQNSELVSAVAHGQNSMVRLHKTMAEAMDRQMALFNLPTRSDLLALTEDIAELRSHLARIEDRLADVANGGKETG